jgi:protein-disulfide isomerase
MSDMGKIILTGTACLALGLVAGHYIPTVSETSSSGSIDRGEVEQIVADYIADNPGQIIASLQGMQQREAEKEQAKRTDAVKNNLEALYDDSNSPSIGSDESGITLVEFFDYRCGYCKRISDTVQKVAEAHPDVKIVFKEFPILSEDSRKAAQAALAVAYLKPERYLDFHMMLMKHQGDYDLESLKDYAGKIEVDLAAFEKEMAGERVLKEIQTVEDLAGELGVQGTPAIVIGEELIPGAIPFEELDRRIKALKQR